MESMESHKDGFPPFPHPLEIPSGLPHSHSFDDGENMYLDRQTPPKTLDQSHFQRRGVVNHVSGLKRKGCPGTLSLTPALRATSQARAWRLRACDWTRHNRRNL